MDARVGKLIHQGVDERDAEALVKAKLDTPRKIKAAKDSDIEAVPGIGKAKREALRRRFPKGK